MDALVKPVLLDIALVSKWFSFASVTEVSRQMVGSAHILAKRMKQVSGMHSYVFIKKIKNKTAL